MSMKKTVAVVGLLVTCAAGCSGGGDASSGAAASASSSLSSTTTTTTPGPAAFDEWAQGKTLGPWVPDTADKRLQYGQMACAALDSSQTFDGAIDNLRRQATDEPDSIPAADAEAWIRAAATNLCPQNKSKVP